MKITENKRMYIEGVEMATKYIESYPDQRSSFVKYTETAMFLPAPFKRGLLDAYYGRVLLA